MTQATHPSSVCQPTPQLSIGLRLRKAIGRLKMHRSIRDPEPENLAGFSVRYRNETCTQQAQQRDLIILTMAHRNGS